MAGTPVGVTTIHRPETVPVASQAPVLLSWTRDRRDRETRERLLQRVRSEFDDMPGLILTLVQAVRLFGLRKDVCIRVLGELDAEGLLCQASDERYARRDMLVKRSTSDANSMEVRS